MARADREPTRKWLVAQLHAAEAERDGLAARLRLAEQNANELSDELLAVRRFLWYVVASAGGEVRVDRELIANNRFGGELARYEDTAARQTVIATKRRM